METKALFCDTCPLRAKYGDDESVMPAGLGDSTPASPTTARHLLGSNIDAVKYQTVNTAGEPLTRGPSVVVAAATPREAVTEAFSSCTGPATSSLRFKVDLGPVHFDQRVSIGQQCMALVGLEETRHRPQPESVPQAAIRTAII